MLTLRQKFFIIFILSFLVVIGYVVYPKSYNLSVKEIGQGVVHLSAAGPYNSGTIISATALPNAGWKFVNWGEDVNGKNNPLEIIMDKNKTISAVFEPVSYTIVKDIVGKGLIVLNPARSSYQYGESVHVEAIPQDGWVFSNWNSVDNINPKDIIIQGNSTITAIFQLKTFVINSSSSLGGIITPSGSVEVKYGEQKKFTISPEVGFSIQDVLVDEVSLGNIKEYTFINIVNNHKIHAVFDVNSTLTYNLKILIEGSATVPKNPNYSSYLKSTEVALTATPAEGWKFIGWSGNYGNNSQITLVMDHDIEIKAIFEAVPQNVYYLNLTILGSGVVLPNTQGPYANGTVINLVADPESGWKFTSWGGDVVESSNPLRLVLNSNKTIVANFSKIMTTTRVLIYSDELENEMLMSRAPVVAAKNLNYSVSAHANYYSFISDLTSGTHWDLVIFNEELYNASSTTYDAIDTYIKNGGRAIISSYNIRNSKSHSLWSTLGVSYASDLIFSGTKVVYTWDSSSELFNLPNKIPLSFVIRDKEGFGIDGVLVRKINGSTLMLGDVQSVEDGRGLIVVSNNGSTIFNGLNTGTMNLDQDADNKSDGIEIWENEIRLILH